MSDRFIIETWIRDGGMAALYRARHAKTGARVAIKLQFPTGAHDEVLQARFDREAEVMGRLSGSPNIVRVYDMDTLDDGRRYIATEWLTGSNLEELLDDLRNAEERLPLDRLLRIGLAIASGLDTIHAHEVVHRDLKPANIMVDATTTGDQVTLVDFGISADLGTGGQRQELTTTGMILGTSGYMAPEQAAGLPAEPAFDIFAFGAVLYEAATGNRLPPSGWASDLPTVTDLRPEVPEALSQLIASCLERHPDKRPSNAREILRILEQLLQPRARTPEPLRPPTPTMTSSREVVVVSSPGLQVPVHPSGSVPLPGATPRPNATPRSAAPSRRGWVVLLLLLLIATTTVLVFLVREESEPSFASRSEGLVTGPEARTAILSEPETHPPAPPKALREHNGPKVTVPEAASGGTSGEVAPEMAPLDPASLTPRTLPPESTSRTPPSPPRIQKPRPTKSFPNPKAPAPPEAHDPSVPKSVPSSSPQIPAHQTQQCVAIRDRAQTALHSRQWMTVLSHTKVSSECWSSSSQRVALRVRAHFELGHARACVREGRGYTDPNIEPWVRACKSQLSSP